MSDTIDPRTPVIIGVGQVSDPIDSSEYHRWSAVDLAANAARAAILDAGVDPATIDTVAGVRQFEISTPVATAPLGKSNNYPRSVAARIGAAPQRAVLEVAGGQSPQHLITEFAGVIARDEAETVLIFGSEAISTTRALVGREDAPDFSEEIDGDLEDRGYGLDGLVDAAQGEHALTGAPEQYALFDTARRLRNQNSREDYAREIGELFAPFTDVAAANPFAAAPVRRDADDLMTVTERNRMIADPYPRFVVARDQVNQGAAVLLTSVASARAAGVPEARWVYLHGHADLCERTLLNRPDLSTSPASVRAAAMAIERAGTSNDAISTFDLYSCFPIAVLNITDGLGLSHVDERGLTLTGGLPFFGGAGNNYSMHAVVETVHRLRQRPGTLGFVGANGGLLSKYSAAVYSTTYKPWVASSDEDAQHALDAAPTVPIVEHPTGPVTIETSTVKYGRGDAIGIVIGRDAEDRRFIATTVPGDTATVTALLAEDPQERRLFAAHVGAHNFVALLEDTLRSVTAA